MPAQSAIDHLREKAQRIARETVDRDNALTRQAYLDGLADLYAQVRSVLQDLSRDGLVKIEDDAVELDELGERYVAPMLVVWFGRHHRVRLQPRGRLGTQSSGRVDLLGPLSVHRLLSLPDANGRSEWYAITTDASSVAKLTPAGISKLIDDTLPA